MLWKFQEFCCSKKMDFWCVGTLQLAEFRFCDDENENEAEKQIVTDEEWQMDKIVPRKYCTFSRMHGKSIDINYVTSSLLKVLEI